MASNRERVETFTTDPRVFPWFQERCIKSGRLSRKWIDTVDKSCPMRRVSSTTSTPSLEDFCVALALPFATLRQQGRHELIRRIKIAGSELEAGVQQYLAAAKTTNEREHDDEMPVSTAETCAKRASTEDAAAASIDESTPAKRLKCAGDEQILITTPPGISNTPTGRTPASPGHLSAASAQRLAESSRKSPLPACSPSGADQAPHVAAVRCADYTACVSAKESHLLLVVNEKVRTAYEYVKAKGLPQQNKDTEQDKMWRVLICFLLCRKDSGEQV